MRIKIYFDDKPVYLCDEMDATLSELVHHPDTVFIDEVSPPAIKSLLHEIKKETFHAGILLGGDFHLLQQLFFKQFELIEAAGGVVENEQGELLFIYRLGRWDLPKGKVEPGEDLPACAAREITEETGVTDLSLQQKLTATYHTYNAFGKHFLKVSHWYYFTCPAGQQLTPQTEEDITGTEWVAASNLAAPLAHTYPSIRDVLDVFKGIHPDR